jgi:hypothetical protein
MGNWFRMALVYQAARCAKRRQQLERAPMTAIILALPLAVAGWLLIFLAIRALIG